MNLAGAERAAGVLKLTAGTVRRWTAEVPPSRAGAAREFIAAAEQAVEKQRKARERGRRAVRELVKQSYSEGVIERPRRFSRLREGDNTYGHEAQAAYEEILSEGLIDRIVEFLSNFRPVERGSSWLATVTASELLSREPGERRRTAYPSIIVRIDHPLTRFFTNQVVFPTGRQRSLGAVASIVRELLERALGDTSIYLIHAAYVYSYSYRQEPGRRRRRR